MKGAALVLLLAGCVSPPAAPGPMPDWEARFRKPASGWRGADAVYSVPLSGDRILWLFGDTFVTAPDAKGREGASFIRNSLAVQLLPGDPRFFWRTKAGKPADALECPVPGEWLWPLSGLRIGPVLRLFAMRLKAQGSCAFGFAVTGNALLSVDNPDDPPDEWRIRSKELTFPGCTFGAASLLADDAVYVYGHRKGSGDLLVARTRPELLDDFSTWSFQGPAGWSGLDGAGVLFREAATEMSVFRLGDRFVAVTSAPFLSPDILVRTSPGPEGPWSAPRLATMPSTIAWSLVATWSLLVMGVSRAMVGSSGLGEYCVL